MMRRSFTLLNGNWREQGISYLKYLNVCTEALHSAMKESRRVKYERYSSPGYVAQKPDGAGGIETVNKVPAHTNEY
ncbi:hypothetical protein C3747_7g2443c [Trypanosoma cruzi]|uniref:Mitochondrial ATP synthase epsilon chain n=2 Tax=Trypanosoma cruzi TaxID=5693 RepID=Q4CX02_TRYCC|nr:hypothetical protein, conserved [Trypanosoma cruzi]XP_806886.1 hypothetical protein, conserved [Trypanosoma cruzi]EAN84807.1 hypothetical protein, conserved [Trypanosoma cruzi]EAN85035.1 hypothetical protein, conserved [Trypanosoma cruzi]KAF8289070.1 putative Mitochondrial ATP synthase epsilon chain [Trypanosoma cruzi]PWU98119.1 hypothetical protein C4B63_13g1339c [Trypanosoma cruzi]PWV09950.1 hypothetical protein C3747_73g165c [Trypanosoma cruzi]|eukprot:XP_806658.1 hypothetical protein [Trypanosoma cruzi strain CL Brener]